MLCIAEQGVVHDYLVLRILHLIEHIVVEYERAEEFRIVILYDFEDRSQSGHLIE